jgi:DNA-binding NarL/FixJ family response regulator
MQPQPGNDTYDAFREPRRGPQNKLLLVGSDGAFDGEIARRIFFGHSFQIAGRSTALLDALGRLESEAIDIVLLSSEFCAEELSLFAFDALRRGFAGLVLHVASLSTGLARPTQAAYGGTSATQLARKASSLEAQSPDADPRRSMDSPPLTEKERAVLTRVSNGMSNLQIACDLGCSEGSIKAVIQQLFGKFGVRKRAQIVRMAFEKSLIRL